MGTWAGSVSRSQKTLPSPPPTFSQMAAPWHRRPVREDAPVSPHSGKHSSPPICFLSWMLCIRPTSSHTSGRPMLSVPQRRGSWLVKGGGRLPQGQIKAHTVLSLRNLLPPQMPLSLPFSFFCWLTLWRPPSLKVGEEGNITSILHSKTVKGLLFSSLCLRQQRKWKKTKTKNSLHFLFLLAP